MTPLTGGEKKQLPIYFRLFIGAPSLPSVSVQKSAPSDTSGFLSHWTRVFLQYCCWSSGEPCQTPRNLTKKSPLKNIPSREVTYPTLGKGKSSSKCHFLGDMLVPWRVEDFLLLFLGQFLASFSGFDFSFWKGGWNLKGFIPKIWP